MRDIVAPRFANMAISDLKTALSRNDKNAIDVGLSLLRRYIKFLRGSAQWKMKLRIAMTFFRFNFLGILLQLFKRKNETNPISRGLDEP